MKNVTALQLIERDNRRFLTLGAAKRTQSRLSGYLQHTARFYSSWEGQPPLFTLLEKIEPSGMLQVYLLE
ncbi:hypothetical protein [Allocoleopsis sp.]|uniref:hypothetical protein n=1 Tax=Allocoleopsis sp. TaxID=3088169 RepID=UPI002FD551DC